MSIGGEVTIFLPDFHLRPYTREVCTDVLVKAISRIINRHSSCESTPKVVFLGDLGENLLDKDPKYLVESKFGTELGRLLSNLTAILVRGNHEPDFLSRDIKNLGFSAFVDCLKISSGGKSFLVEHGHLILEKVKVGEDGEGKFAHFFDKVDNILCALLSEKMMSYMHRLAFNVVFPILGKRFHLGAKWNQIIVEEVQDSEYTHICGHTHFKHDSDGNYVNPGAYNRNIIKYVVLCNGLIYHLEENL